jgi:hypothetical protein
MPTPHVYIKGLQVARKYAPQRRYVLMFFAVALLCLIVGHFWPAFDRAFGLGWFVLLVCYFSVLPPYYSYRKKALTQPMPKVTAGDWAKAVLCNLWMLVCIVAIYATFFSRRGCP